MRQIKIAAVALALLAGVTTGAQSQGGMARDARDRLEDVWERRENVRDSRENRRDRREDLRDRREDLRDRREDRRDALYDGGRRDRRTP